MTLTDWARAHAATVRPGTITGAVPALDPDITDWQLMRTLDTASDGRVVAATVDGDARVLVAVGSNTGMIRSYDAGSGELLREFHHESIGDVSYTDGVMALAWTTSPDGAPRLVAGNRRGRVRVWDLETGQSHADIEMRGLCVGVSPLRNPDGSGLLATAGVGGRVWDLDTGEPLAQPQGIETSWSAVWTEDGRGDAGLAVVSAARAVSTWNKDSGAETAISRFLDGRGSVGTTCVRAESGRHLLVVARSHKIEVFELESGDCTTVTVSGAGLMPFAPVAGVSLPSGRPLLAAGTYDGLGFFDPVTGALLHREPERVRRIAITALPDGRLLLATTGSGGLRLLTTPEPPRRPGGTPPALADVTFVPGWSLDENEELWSVAFSADRDGVRLAAAGDDRILIWDVTTGICERTLDTAPVSSRDIDWEPRAGRPRRLLVTGDDGMWGWDVGDPARPRSSIVDGSFYCGAGVRDADGRWLVAAADDRSGSTVVVDVDSGDVLRRFSEPVPVWSLDLHTTAGGRVVLAVADVDGSVSVRDALSGDVLCTADVSGPNEIQAIRLAEPPGGGLWFAATRFAGDVEIWDALGGVRLTALTGHTGSSWSLAWIRTADGRLLLASGGHDETVRIWDTPTGECLQVLEAASSGDTLDLTSLPDGRILLAAGGLHSVLLWTTTAPITPPRHTGAAPASRRPAGTTRPAELISLGAAGMWLPLGLLDELVTLTGPAVEPSDPALRALTTHPGVTALRALRWPPAARVAFAALLASGLTVDERYGPPSGTGPAEQGAALDTALHRPVPHHPAAADPAALAAAAEQITDRTVTLLMIVGPDAAALNPLLPLRLAHHAPSLPVLDPGLRGLIAGTDPDTARADAASTAWAPGSVGVTRQGPLRTVLLTEHALPADLFRMRLAAGQLLHRHHPAAADPRGRPLTLVLDTTPPAYGAPEGLLRTIGHLLVRALWSGGHTPLLVGLDRPGHAEPVTGPDALVRLWTGRTLRPPDLPTALRTAAAAGPYPVVTLTVHHGADQHGPPTPARQLVTTHQPGRPPAREVVAAHRHHLPPDAGRTRVEAVVAAVLDAGFRDGHR